MQLNRTLVLAAAQLALCMLPAAAQNPPRPHKRVDAVVQGMTPAQVRAVLGEPLRVRSEGGLTYLYYANGCANCQEDYVVVRDCRVVGGRFDNPSRQIVRGALPAQVGEPPAAECQVSSAGAAPTVAAVAMAAPSDTGGAPQARPSGRPAPHLAGVRADSAAQASAVAMAPPADTVPRTPPPPADAGPGGAAPAAAPVAAPPAPEAVLPAQSPGNWRQQLTLRRPRTHLIAVPAASINSPTAFGVQMGEAFVGVGYQQRTRFTHQDDGAVVVGMGLGDRARYVGLELAASSYSTIRGGGPLETGGFSFKLHRTFGDTWGVAVGYENAVTWGGSDAGHSPYAVGTHVFRLKDDPSSPLSAMVASLGVGGGRFRSEDAVVEDRKTANVFGAVGLQVLEPVSLMADWTGQDLFAGVSVTPLRRVPMVVNLGLADLTGSAGDGARFVASVALGFRYLPPFF